MTIFTGSAVALVTPFLADAEIDWPAFETLVDYHLEHQTDALVITGTTGESSTLSDEEQIDLIEVAVKRSAGRKPIIAGTGINDTRHAIKLSQAAEKVGADALLIVTPYYNKTSYQGMLAHFRAIADSVNLPIILYHVPGRTGATLTVEQVVELAQHPNIVAIKDATGDMTYTQELLAKVPENFSVYSGNDDQTFEMMKLGGLGTISVTANVLADDIHQMCQYLLEGQIAAAEAIHQELAGINHDLFIEVNPIPVKYLVHKMGLCELNYRLPLVAPAAETQAILSQYED